MAVISANTFDAFKRYVAVRLQQGVPLVDADWNAMEDTRRYELRAYLKWFVGDGIPESNDGFRIVGQNAVNDFRISKGYSGAADPVARIGRAIVDGLDVIIRDDQPFRLQPLHVAQGAAATALAATLGVPVIAEMPVLDGTVAVYLDIWERLVTPSEDPTLVLPGLGTESCARLKREWVVRTRTGTAAPTPADVSEYINGHSYYLLATVARRAAAGNVRPEDVADRRELRLLTPPAFLITDVLGTAPADYRRGLGRPVISLREAVNALLRGEVPSSPESAIAAAPGLDQHRRGFFVDANNGLDIIWQSDRVGAANQVFGARMDLANIPAGFPGPPVQITTGTPPSSEPHATLVPGGDVVVAYTRGAGPNADVFLRRGPLANLGAASEQAVANAPGVQQDTPFVITSGNMVVVLWHDATTNLWMYRRYRHTDNTFVDPTPGLQLSSFPAIQKQIHAATDPAGNVWVAFRADTGIRALSFAPTTGTATNETTHSAGGPAGGEQDPFVLCRANGEVHVFWSNPGATSGIFTASFGTSALGWTVATQALPFIAPDVAQPAAVELADRRIWLLYTRAIAPNRDVFASVRTATTGGPSPGTMGNFGCLIQLTFDTHDDFQPFGTVDSSTGALYVLWVSDRAGNLDLFHRRFVTAV